MKEEKKTKKNQANKPWLQILLPGLIHWWKCCDVSKGQDTGKFVCELNSTELHQVQQKMTHIRQV